MNYREHLAFWLLLLAPARLGPAFFVPFRDVDISDKLRTIVMSGRIQAMRWPDFRDVQPSAFEVYEKNRFTPLWIVDGRLTSKGRSIIEALSRSAEKGLNAEDYDVPMLKQQLREPSDALSYAFRGLAALDVTITVGLMRYASALHQGRVHPCRLHFAIREKELLDAGAFVLTYHSSDVDLEKQIAGIEPPFSGYRNTLDALLSYQRLSISPEPLMPRRPARPLKRGDRYPDMGRLESRLRFLGDLKYSASETATGTKYDGPVLDALKSFQQRHGLPETGTLDPDTYEALSTPIAFRIEQLKITLERWRWLPSSIAPAVVVNIPEYELRAFDEKGQLSLKMRVIVGKAYRRRTPVFEDQLRTVIIRPTWDVPLSIQKNEIVSQVRVDPQYLSKHNFIIVDPKNRAASLRVDTESLNKLESGILRLRQLAGPRNALGLLKFDFPNEYSVYLHGTPANELFSKARRDFSHGCIRVEDPLSLAEWVLRGRGGWTRERLTSASAGSSTLRIPISRPIPVLVLYGTAIIRSDGVIHFFHDVYGYDAELRIALAHGYPYSSSCTNSLIPANNQL